MNTTRAEHLQWCKDRAMEYVNAGDLDQALMSMYSDLNKHIETEGHPDVQFGVILQMGGYLSTTKEVKDFILGFN